MRIRMPDNPGWTKKAGAVTRSAKTAVNNPARAAERIAAKTATGKTVKAETETAVEATTMQTFKAAKAAVNITGSQSFEAVSKAAARAADRDKIKPPVNAGAKVTAGMTIKALAKTAKSLAAAAAVSALVAGCSLLPKEEEPLVPPLVEPAQMRIDTSEVKRETIIRSIKGTAVLESVSTEYHHFTQGGYRLAEMLVSAGDEVKQGDVLARLDVPGVEKEMLARQIEVEKKKLALKDARASGDPDKVKLAMMELELAEMELEETRSKWESRELVAKMDGIVTFAERLEPGDWVEPYQTLVIVADPAKLQLSYSVSNPSQLADVEVGMDAKVVYQGQELKGKVVQTPGSAPYVEDERLRDKYSRSLYIDLEQIPENAEIGDMADVEIITDVRENVLTIPKSALRQYFGRTYVHVLDGEQRREVDVEVGLENATSVEIVSGLEEGQLVIHP